jgi:hypothetical protein
MTFPSDDYPLRPIELPHRPDGHSVAGPSSWVSWAPCTCKYLGHNTLRCNAPAVGRAGVCGALVVWARYGPGCGPG